MIRMLLTYVRRTSLRAAVSLAAAMYVITGPTHAAFDSSIDSSSRSERRILADALDGQLQSYSLIEAALVASGNTSPAEVDRLLKEFESVASRLRNSLDPSASVADRAVAIHAFLHKHVIATYQSDASDVGVALSTGIYNCVSGSVLYVAFARSCGLNAHAVQLPEHVRCEVLADGMALPIETTSRNPAATTHGRRGRSRTLTDVTILATLYYNRGVAAFDGGDLDGAISLNTIAIDLDPACHVARENLLAAINNRVVELVKSSQPTAARQLLEQGLRIDPAYRPFLANRAYLQQLP